VRYTGFLKIIETMNV